MFVKSQNPVMGRPLAEALLSALDTVPLAALLVTPKVHLFTAGPNPITPASLPANFTEATFAGYAVQALTLPLLGPINGSGQVIGVHNEVDFLAGAVVAPGEIILGYWVDELVAAGTKMYYGELFAVPIPIVNPGDFVSIDMIAMLPMLLAGVF